MKRRSFKKTFEKHPSHGMPMVRLKRIEPSMDVNYNNPVAILWGDKVLAHVEFDDIFDEDGNRFKDD